MMLALWSVLFAAQASVPAQPVEAPVADRVLLTLTATDFSAGRPSVAHLGGVYESFTASGNPFDLAGGFLVFTPNASGGYDSRYVPHP